MPETRANQEEKAMRVVDEGQLIATFFFGPHMFGLPVEEVIEINKDLEVTPVPLAPPYVAGIINLRGQILTAINLAKRVGLKYELKDGANYHNVICGTRDEPVSLQVERIGDVINVPTHLIEPPPADIEGLDVRYVKNVSKLPDRLLVILNGELVRASN
ncbi:chemotaxis protein CheW [Thermosulfuriphilus sp.]